MLSKQHTCSLNIKKVLQSTCKTFFVEYNGIEPMTF